MSRRLPPPAPECLERRYRSSQKGGTLIAEDVLDLAAHERRICDPDGYRPARCERCGHSVLHVHDYRERVLRGEPDRPVTRIVRHRCAHRDCHAIWQVIPLLLARHLWRTWSTVRAAVIGPRSPGRPAVPARTKRRWRQRLSASARQLVVALASSGRRALVQLAQRVGLGGARADLVTAVGTDIAALAALIHRLVPGVRLM